VLVAQRVLGGPEECHRRHPLGIGPGTLLAAPAGPRRAVAAVGRPGEHPLVRVLRDGVEAPGAKATDLLGPPAHARVPVLGGDPILVGSAQVVPDSLYGDI